MALPNGKAIAPFLQTLAAVARRLPSPQQLQHYLDLCVMLMERTSGLSQRAGCDEDSKAQINAANLEALEREVHAARAASGGRGLIGRASCRERV